MSLSLSVSVSSFFKLVKEGVCLYRSTVGSLSISFSLVSFFFVIFSFCIRLSTPRKGGISLFLLTLKDLALYIHLSGSLFGRVFFSFSSSFPSTGSCY